MVHSRHPNFASTLLVVIMNTSFSFHTTSLAYSPLIRRTTTSTRLLQTRRGVLSRHSSSVEDRTTAATGGHHPASNNVAPLSFVPFWELGENEERAAAAAVPVTEAPLSFVPFWDQQQQQQQHGSGKEPATSSTSAKTISDLTTTGLFTAGEPENTVPSSADPNHLENKTEMDPQKILLPLIGLLTAAGLGAAANMGLTVTDVVSTVENFIANPQASLQSVVDSVQAMGPLGPFYFGVFYLIAELLAIPATPLTMSAGYLFGMTQGVGVVLTAATIAASISFVVGKTFLRSWVEGILEEQPKFAKLDKAVGEQGFKLLLLVRLSPIFPFALSNYLYGASSINFSAYFWGTLLGFAPGTIAYVYTGMVGKELLLGDGSQPWYLYAAGFGVLLTFLKLVTDVASGIVEAIDDDETVVSP